MRLAALPILATALMLSACSVSGPVRVSGAGAVRLPSEVALDTGPEGQPDPMLRQFSERLAADLVAKGVRHRAGAAYRLMVSLSEADATTGITQDKTGDPRSLNWQSAPRSNHWYENCKPRRLRAVAVGLDSAGASSRVSAELDLCKADPHGVNLLADELARRLVSPAGQPAPQG